MTVADNAKPGTDDDVHSGWNRKKPQDVLVQNRIATARRVKRNAESKFAVHEKHGIWPPASTRQEAG